MAQIPPTWVNWVNPALMKGILVPERYDLGKSFNTIDIVIDIMGV